MRLSKATLAAALALAFAAPWAAAAGVSSVSVKSSLYEPLRADVRIALGPQDDYSSGAFKIASRERFAAAGVDYPQAVGDLSLTYERATARPGEAVLRIASSRPVYDPVLRLVLEARLADNSHVYLPVTVMLDTAFERPLGSASLEASLPSGAAQTAAKPAAIQTAPKRPAGSKPAARPAAKPTTAPAKVSVPPPISAPVSDAKANASPPAPVSDANVSTSAAAPATPPASPSEALAPGSAPAAASLPASEDPSIVALPADPAPSAASPTLDSAAPAEPVAAPAQIAPPAPIAPIAPPAEPEPSWMDSAMEFWPVAAGLAGLGALAGLLALRRRKQGAAQNVDTEGDGSQVHEPSLGPSTFDPADQGPPTEASTDFGPAIAERSFASPSGRESIDDLQAQIFSDDPMASLVDALDHEAKADAVDTRGYDPMGDLSAPAAQPSFDPDFGMAFELPAVDEPQQPLAGLDSIGQPEAGFSLQKTPDAGPSLAKAPQAEPLDFSPSFSTTLQEPAVEPAPLDFQLPSFDAEPISIGALEMELQPKDDFSQTIAMAQAIQARSAGPAALAFDIAPTLGDVDGRVQLELACLYAQAGDWAEASAQLKEVISDEDLAPSHAEARRLLALIP